MDLKWTKKDQKWTENTTNVDQKLTKNRPNNRPERA